MIEIALEFFYGLFSLTGARKNKKLTNPLLVVFLSLWLVLILSLTLIFG